MKVIYVAGPYRANTTWEIQQNIRQAEEQAFEVWKLGAVALCPHTNSQHFEGSFSDTTMIEGTKELMRRCDAVFVTGKWQDSEGTKGEIAEAEKLNMPVFYCIEELSYFIKGV